MVAQNRRVSDQGRNPEFEPRWPDGQQKCSEPVGAAGSKSEACPRVRDPVRRQLGPRQVRTYSELRRSLAATLDAVVADHHPVIITVAELRQRRRRA